MITNTDTIKEAIQIVDIISDFVPIKRKGANYTGCCPFHNEKTPSFIVFPSTNKFKCFGCGKGGDAIYFIQEHEGFSYTEAITYIAAKFHIPIEQGQQTQADTEAKTRKDSILVALQWAARHFIENYNKNKTAQEYVNFRQLTDAVPVFSIGYAESGNALMRAAQSAGFPTDILFDAGLINKNDQGLFYDTFIKRLIFPFFDRAGRIIGFTGRIISAETDKAKYLHTKDTEVFKKSKFLFGLYQSKREIMKQNECLLVEGQTDTISLFNANIRNSVAGSGTSLSADQVNMIKTLNTCLTLVYDDDPAGIKASIANIKIPLQAGLDVYVVVLPKDEDPDSFVRKVGPEAMAEYFKNNRRDIVSFRINLIKEEVQNDPLQKARLVKDLTSQISLIPDEQTRDILIGEIARQLDVRADDVVKQVKKLLPKPEEASPKGFYGLDASADCITALNQAIILPDPSQVVTRHAIGFENTISLPFEPLDRNDIFKLSKLTKNVVIESMTSIVDDTDTETQLATAARLLTENGFRVETLYETSVFNEDGKNIPGSMDSSITMSIISHATYPITPIPSVQKNTSKWCASSFQNLTIP